MYFMEERKFLLIYHREDNDGVFSGAIFYHYLVNELKISEDNITLMGADYNQLSEFAASTTPKQLHQKYTDLVMTDISFNDTAYMKKLWSEFGNSFVWCDHHAPIIKESFVKHFDDVPGVRETNRSAILCVWKFLYDPFDEYYNNQDTPELLRILSAWDSWTYEQMGYERKEVMDVNRGVTTKFNLEFPKVYEYISTRMEDTLFKTHCLVDYDVVEFRKTGEVINAFIEQDITNIIRDSGDFNWKLQSTEPARSAIAIFHMGATNSTMFEPFKGKADNGIVFKHQKNGNWTVSLYNTHSDDTFHCGEYMKTHFNGGGHQGAAGCTLTQEQFIECLKSKLL